LKVALKVMGGFDAPTKTLTRMKQINCSISHGERYEKGLRLVTSELVPAFPLQATIKRN
jgi:hypothetical protein